MWKRQYRSEEDMKRFEIFKNISFRKRIFIIYIIGGMIPFIFSSYYANTQGRKTMLELGKDTQTTELSLMKDQIDESMEVIEKVSTKLYINDTLKEVAVKRYKSNKEFVKNCERLKLIDDYAYDYEQDISDIIIYTNNSTITTNKYFARIGSSVTLQEWYEPTCKRGGALYWGFGYDREMKEKRPQLTRQVKDEYGNTLYIIAIQLQFYDIKKFISNRSVNTAMLYNNDEVLYTNFKVDNGEWDFAFKHLRRYSYMDFCGTLSRGVNDYIVTYTKIYQMDTGITYTLLSIVDYRDIIKEMNEDNLRGYVTMFMGIAISVMLIIVFSNVHGKRMDLFNEQMHLVAIGEYDKVTPIDGSDEIAGLYKELEKMIQDNKELMHSVVENQIKQEKLHTKQMEVEFKMLASQINPHFLYNTLETIRMKALVNNQREIAELVKMLAKLMRRNIQVSDRMVTLKSEIDSIECYLKIQNYRFGDRITSKVEVEKGVDINAKVLPLVIQPFVENAFVHGLEGVESNGKLLVNIKREVEIIKITVQDNGTGMDYYQLGELRRILNSGLETEDAQTHIGISNVNQRIKLQYGYTPGVEIYSKKGKGTTVVISMPYYWKSI